MSTIDWAQTIVLGLLVLVQLVHRFGFVPTIVERFVRVEQMAAQAASDAHEASERAQEAKDEARRMGP